MKHRHVEGYELITNSVDNDLSPAGKRSQLENEPLSFKSMFDSCPCADFLLAAMSIFRLSIFSFLSDIHRQNYLPTATHCCSFSFLCTRPLAVRRQASPMQVTQRELLLEVFACRRLLSLSFPQDRQHSYRATAFSTPWISWEPSVWKAAVQLCLSVFSSSSVNIHGF